VKRPTNRYAEPKRPLLERLLVRGTLLLLMAAVIGTLSGLTERVRAAEDTPPVAPSFVARRMGTLSGQLEAARGELSLVKVQLDRANAIIENSAKYRIPADLAADIYDVALSEGIDPALGFRLVKVESSFRGNARSSKKAIGYTQLQVRTARFYDSGVTEKDLYDRGTNLRLGFRFLNDLLERFDHDMHLALLAYNRGPARVDQILAKGGNPANGYSDAVLKGYRAPKSGGTH
jgi:soluble lytic murein transglycosylase-like protein